jgi:hypothetical protein
MWSIPNADRRRAGPLDETVVDKELWAMIGGVGAPWTVEDLHATGRLHRISAAG